MISASVILIFFLGLTGLVLDRAFSHSAEEAVRARLQGQIFSLLASAEFLDLDEQLRVGEPLPDPRLSSPQSGLYARIYTKGHKLVWRSPSSMGKHLPPVRDIKVAHWHFRRHEQQGAEKVFSLEFAVAWENSEGKQFKFIFQALENFSVYRKQVSSFRNELWGWLLAVVVVLLVAQGIILRWSLKPLREVASDLVRVKSGEVERLHEGYPDEIQGLTEGINTFIDSERTQRDRYRHTLADLAHSLKTPLAVLRASAGDDSPGLEQIDQMKRIIDYQLQRASAAGRTTMGATTPLMQSAERIINSLQKVHAGLGIDCQVKGSPKLVFPGEEGDLLELFGNLLENAFKWARKSIRVTALYETDGSKKVLRITVEDDGKGIADDQKESVLQRGRRADETVAGHGIGLSVVQEIITLYSGQITIGDSIELGGAKIIIAIPML